ncbi:hypothetical protein ACHAXR_010723 [Thalassiosira sp. AJA248-18]
MGVYLLTGTALHSQTRTLYHLTKMNTLATESATLAILGNAELTTSLELQSKSAIDSEEGLLLQSESAELEIDAEREFAKSAAESALGTEYIEEAEMLHEESARDALESEPSLTNAQELEVRSGELQLRAGEDRAAAALDEEKSVALLEESSAAGEVAAGAEEKAAEYEAIAMRKEGQSIKDGEALLKTEAGAAEDAEAMIACAPIPILNFFCEAIGSVIETGYQGFAAFEGAKSAVETISAVSAQRKEHAELILAIEKQEEAARLAFEAEEFQGLANEESGKALVEEGESEAAGVEAGEAQLLGEELVEKSEEEEALAVFDEEKASEEYAKAARDESIALEEESSAIASQIESEELLSESTSEEFESLSERFDGESKDAKAGNMMKESIGHGMHALGFVLHAVITACLVIYLVVMKGLVEIVVPCIGRHWNGESTLSASHVAERTCGFIFHVGVVIGTIASLPNILLNLEDMPAPLKIRALFYLAVTAGFIESLGIHSAHAACRCYTKGMEATSTVAAVILAFLSNAVHLVPVVLIEMLIVTIILGPGIFDDFALNPLWVWGILSLLVCIYIGVTLRVVESKSAPQSSIEGGEHELLCASHGQPKQPPVSDIEKEYGSMEDVSLLSDGMSSESKVSSSSSKSTSNSSNCFVRYCEGLRLSSDLLVLAIMAMLLWHCWPTMRVLHPLAKASLGMVSLAH